MSNQLAFSLFTNKKGLMTKRISLVNGELHKESAADLYEGTCARRAVDDLREFAAELKSLGTNQAIAFGVPNMLGDIIPVTTKARVIDGLMARSSDYMAFATIPGILMLDYDPQPGKQPLNRDALMAAVCDVGLNGIEMLLTASASSCIKSGDGRIDTGLTGQRIYIAVEDSSRIPELGRIIFDRLWLAGHGFIFLDKTGRMSCRTLVDSCVWQPERLDFAAGAVCGEGLSRNAEGTVGLVEGRRLSILTPLPESEQSELSRLQNEAKSLVQADAVAIRESYTAERVTELVNGGMKQADASAAVERLLSDDDAAALPAEWGCMLNDGTRIAAGDICRRHEEFDGKSMRDPLDHGYGKNRAKFYWNNGSPTIHSLAHGVSKTYILQPPADLLFADVPTALSQPQQNNAKINQARLEDGRPDMSWTAKFEVSDEDMERIADPKWVVENLIIQGHFIVIPAPPNGGKTTIMLYLSRQMVAAGYQVFYVNADVSGADAKGMQKQAKKHGFTLMLPDFHPGLSMSNVVDQLQAMTEQDTDFSSVVFIFDTLKKMTDVINKSQAKGLYNILRSLSAKGMTVVCLSHTNKYKGEDGHDVFEGTGDLRADVDEMIFLVPRKNDDGSMTISTRPDKMRGSFKPITFNISADREVNLSSRYVDVAAQRDIDAQIDKDELVIELISDVLSGNKKLSQSELVKAVRLKDGTLGEKKIRAVLTRWASGPKRLWAVEEGREKNRKEYSNLAGAESGDISFL